MKTRWLVPGLLAAVASLALALAIQAPAFASITIDSGSFQFSDLAIAGGRAGWTSYQGVSICDLATGNRTQVSPASTYWGPRYEFGALSSDWVSWTSYYDGSLHTFTHDFTTGKNRELTSPAIMARQFAAKDWLVSVDEASDLAHGQLTATNVKTSETRRLLSTIKDPVVNAASYPWVQVQEGNDLGVESNVPVRQLLFNLETSATVVLEDRMGDPEHPQRNYSLTDNTLVTKVPRPGSPLANYVFDVVLTDLTTSKQTTIPVGMAAGGQDWISLPGVDSPVVADNGWLFWDAVAHGPGSPTGSAVFGYNVGHPELGIIRVSPPEPYSPGPAYMPTAGSGWLAWRQDGSSYAGAEVIMREPGTWQVAPGTGFANPIAYGLKSLQSSKFRCTPDTGGLWAELTIPDDTGHGLPRTIFKGALGAAGQTATFPAWDGKLARGLSMKPGSHQWVLTLAKGGHQRTITGTIVVAYNCFTIKGFGTGGPQVIPRFMVDRAANVYLQGASLSASVRGPNRYSASLGSSGAGQLATRTVYLRGKSAPTVRMGYDFTIRAPEGSRYSITVVQ